MNRYTDQYPESNGEGTMYEAMVLEAAKRDKIETPLEELDAGDETITGDDFFPS